MSQKRCIGDSGRKSAFVEDQKKRKKMAPSEGKNKRADPRDVHGGANRHVLGAVAREHFAAGLGRLSSIKSASNAGDYE